MNELIQILAAKYKGELGVASTIFSLGNNEVATLTITIPAGYYAYLLKISGYATTSDVYVQLQDSGGRGIFDWEEFPDSMHTIEQFPILETSHKDNIKFKFSNTSGTTSNILIVVETLLIPEIYKDEFENKVYKVVDSILSLAK